MKNKTLNKELADKVREFLTDEILFDTGISMLNGSFAKANIKAIIQNPDGSILVSYYATYGINGEYKTEEDEIINVKLIKNENSFSVAEPSEEEIEKLEDS